jgi:hypothetical protein
MSTNARSSFIAVQQFRFVLNANSVLYIGRTINLAQRWVSCHTVGGWLVAYPSF